MLDDINVFTVTMSVTISVFRCDHFRDTVWQPFGNGDGNHMGLYTEMTSQMGLHTEDNQTQGSVQQN